MSTLKQMRGQLRQIAKEMLPEILATELMKAVGDALAKQMAEGFARLDKKQADLQSYLVRQTGVPEKKQD